MEYDAVLRWLHVIGAAVLLGTGAGIAFFMVMARRTGNPQIIAGVARIVVIADFVFTATAAVAQPLTGYLLARNIGWSLSEGWLALSLVLYGAAGLFWLPVIWIQMQIRDAALLSAKDGTPLPARFDRLYRVWFLAGFPAFACVLAIYWLMLARPAIDFP